MEFSTVQVSDFLLQRRLRITVLKARTFLNTGEILLIHANIKLDAVLQAVLNFL